MRGYSQFSFWISIGLAKICFPRRVTNQAKIFLYWQAPSLKAKNATKKQGWHKCDNENVQLVWN